MADDRIELCEFRGAAPVDPAEIAVARAGSLDHARRWLAAGQERMLERMAADARCAAARRRSLSRATRPDAAGVHRATLFFYRTLALRCRDASTR